MSNQSSKQYEMKGRAGRIRSEGVIAPLRPLLKQPHCRPAESRFRLRLPQGAELLGQRTPGTAKAKIVQPASFSFL